jgi:uncharacterized protein (DUF58 family)
MPPQDRAAPSVFLIPLSQFIVGVLLFVALVYGERNLALWALLVLGLATGAKLWAWVSLSGIGCHSSVDKQKAFPDEKLILSVRAENHKFLPVWLQVNVPVGSLSGSPSPERTLTKEARLFWYQRAHLQWELTARRRGVHQIGPSQLFAGDLFAFFSEAKKTEASHSVIVYPRLVSLKSFSFPRRDIFGVPGVKSPVQDPVYILGTRDYQHGQPAKHVHWKASARHHRLQQKIFEPTQKEKLLLVVDVELFAKNKAEEEFERTLEIVASLAVGLDKRGDAVGLLTNGAVVGSGSPSVPVTKSSVQVPAILEVLARLQMEPHRDAVRILRRGLDMSWGMSCVYFAYEEGETVAILREYSRHRGTPVTFFVWQPHLTSKQDRSEAWQEVHRPDELRAKEAPGE